MWKYLFCHLILLHSAKNLWMQRDLQEKVIKKRPSWHLMIGVNWHWVPFCRLLIDWRPDMKDSSMDSRLSSTKAVWCSLNIIQCTFSHFPNNILMREQGHLKELRQSYRTANHWHCVKVSSLPTWPKQGTKESMNEVWSNLFIYLLVWQLNKWKKNYFCSVFIVIPLNPFKVFCNFLDYNFETYLARIWFNIHLPPTAHCTGCNSKIFQNATFRSHT